MLSTSEDKYKNNYFCKPIRCFMKRDVYWDSLKLLLMFCVLYGHLIQSFAPHGSFNCAMTNFVYLFHIPVFVFVSGRFSHIKDRKKYITGIWRLLETYLVFQAIRCFLPLLWHGGDDIITFFILPQWTLWYLISLICWRLLVLFTPDAFLQKQPLTIIISTLIVSVLSGFIPIGGHFSIQRTLAFLPFFCMGYYSTRFDQKSMINKIPAVAAATALVLSFLLLYYFLNVNMMFVTSCKYSYWQFHSISPIVQAVFRLLFLLSALFTGLAVMRLTPVHVSLAHWGSQTLFIYVYHSFAIQAVEAAISHGYLPQHEVLFFLYAVLIFTALIFLSHFRIFHILIHPVSYFKEK